MKLRKAPHANNANESANRSGPLPNPYTLFLILILLINSFGDINRLTSKIKTIFIGKGR